MCGFNSLTVAVRLDVFVLTLPWRTVGMQCYARPQLVYKCYLRPKHGRLQRNGTYKAGPGICKYIRLYTCMYVFNHFLQDDLLRELDFERGKPSLGGLSVEATEERRHAHMAEGHKRRVETRRRRKADRT